MDWHPNGMTGIIGIHPGIPDLQAFIWKCQIDRHPSKIARLLGNLMKLLEMLIFIEFAKIIGYHGVIWGFGIHEGQPD